MLDSVKWMRTQLGATGSRLSSRCLLMGGAAALAALCGSCGALRALTTSLGGSTAGGRGIVRVLFMNNTPDQVVFTAGTYDPADETSVPSAVQLVLNATDGTTLAAHSRSGIGTLACARTLSLGSQKLLDLLAANAPNFSVTPEAGVAGITFYDTSGGGDPVSVATIPAFDARLGVDFPCGALLIFRFEVNDVGDMPFRVDFELIPAVSPR